MHSYISTPQTFWGSTCIDIKNGGYCIPKSRWEFYSIAAPSNMSELRCVSSSMQSTCLSHTAIAYCHITLSQRTFLLSSILERLCSDVSCRFEKYFTACFRTPLFLYLHFPSIYVYLSFYLHIYTPSTLSPYLPPIFPPLHSLYLPFSLPLTLTSLVSSPSPLAPSPSPHTRQVSCILGARI